MSSGADWNRSAELRKPDPSLPSDVTRPEPQCLPFEPALTPEWARCKRGLDVFHLLLDWDGRPETKSREKVSDSIRNRSEDRHEQRE